MKNDPYLLFYRKKDVNEESNLIFLGFSDVPVSLLMWKK